MWMIISSQWHLLGGAVYKRASKHFFLQVDVLESGKMGACDSLTWGTPDTWSLYTHWAYACARLCSEV